MPSAQATALTRRHRAETQRVAALARRQVEAIARGADPVDIDAWWERFGAAVLRIVTGGASVAATLAVRYLVQYAAAEGVGNLQPVRVVPPAEQLATSLRVTGPVAFKTNLTRSGSEVGALRVMTRRLTGAASTRVLDGQRQTVLATFEADDRIVGWRRILESPNPCAFCAMLASRGAVFDEDSVHFETHDDCHCDVEPLWRREPDPPDVVALRDQWEESTVGFKGVDALNAFRRARSS